MNHHDSTEASWAVFHRAAAVRDRLREAEKNLTYEQKRTAKEGIKRETFELLSETYIPQPLKMLVLDLIRGYHVANHGWQAANKLYTDERGVQVDIEQGAKTALARIDANQSSDIGNSRLARLLLDQTGKKIDKTQIKRWRQDPEYKFLVWRFKQDEGGR